MSSGKLEPFSGDKLMSIDEQQLARVEYLRIPLDDPSSPLDWKDWYHYILLDRESGLRVLVNFSLIGRPSLGEIQTTFIVTIPSEILTPQLRSPTPFSTFGIAFPQPWQREMISRELLHFQGQGINLEINGKNALIAVRDEGSRSISINFQAIAQATPLLVTEDSPFGSGFIGWGLVPGLEVRGELLIGEQSFTIDKNWFCYHDRNFGRFRWGEDIGWEWLVVFTQCEDGTPVTLVLDQRTNKNHFQRSLPYIFIYVDNKLSKVFLGDTLNICWEWSSAPTLPLRLPGVMASLFADRTLRVPQRLQVQAADEQDQLLLTLDFESMLELVVPDNQTRQYTFIEELTGIATVNVSLKGKTLHSQGLVYAEYVI
jgi:hypothetical protein